MRASARAATWLLILGLGATAEARLVVDHLVVEGQSKMTTRAMSARMKLRVGDRVNFEKLASARLRLMESELFTSVRVYIDLPVDEAARRMYAGGETDEKIDVHVELQEKTSWFVVPTASFGSGDYAAGVAYGNQDLGGHDLQIVAAAQLGQARSYLFAAFRDPLVNGVPLTWAISGLVRDERIRFFADHAKVLEVPTLVYGGVAELGWVLSPHLRMLVGFSARHQHVGAEEVVDPDLTPPYNPASGRIFVLSLQSSYDDTSAPEGLRRGVRVLLKNELSDHYWGSQFDYAKLEVRGELYGRLAWNYPSLVIDAVFDYPTSSDGVPLTEMLRIGGSNLRGYLVNEFHGDTLVSVQLEDQAMIFRQLPLPFVDTRFNVAAAIFVNAAALLERHPGGTTIDEPASVRPALADFHTSVGAGLRIILPGVAIPALKADIGYGIDVKSFALTVSIGGGS